jgi:hypothetical protein
LRGGFADSEERKPQRSGEVTVRGKRAQCIVAGDNQGLCAIELERHVGCELYGKQRGEHRLMTARGKALSLECGVWFRSRDEEEHQVSER